MTNDVRVEVRDGRHYYYVRRDGQTVGEPISLPSRFVNSDNTVNYERLTQEFLQQRRQPYMSASDERADWRRFTEGLGIQFGRYNEEQFRGEHAAGLLGSVDAETLMGDRYANRTTDAFTQYEARRLLERVFAANGLAPTSAPTLDGQGRIMRLDDHLRGITPAAAGAEADRERMAAQHYTPAQIEARLRRGERPFQPAQNPDRATQEFQRIVRGITQNAPPGSSDYTATVGDQNLVRRFGVHGAVALYLARNSPDISERHGTYTHTRPYSIDDLRGTIERRGQTNHFQASLHLIGLLDTHGITTTAAQRREMMTRFHTVGAEEARSPVAGVYEQANATQGAPTAAATQAPARRPRP